MDYWNHVLWYDETKIHLFGSDGVKRVWPQPGEEYKDKCVLPTVKYGGGSVKSSQVTFIYIALLTIQIVSKHLTVSSWRIECQ